MTPRADAIDRFLVDKASALRRIANATRGDMTFEDVRQEAWLVASDIGKRRGYSLDFGDAEDAELVLAWLFRKLVSFAEKQSRYAQRIDKDWDDSESAGNGLARLLTSPLDADPMQRLLRREEDDGYEQLVRHSFSEASAYVLLLVRFDWDAEELAEGLFITVATLRKRLQRAGIRAKFQASFFDGLVTIDPDFRPTLARRYLKNPLGGPSWLQIDWAMGNAREVRRRKSPLA